MMMTQHRLKKHHTAKLKKRTKARIIRIVWFNKETDPEKHYRELLMLFTPWRNEGSDLLGAFSCYQDRYMLLSDAINKQMKLYVVCNEDFHEIQQEMNRIEERFDEIAPCTQSLEHEDQAEGDQDLHPDFSGNYNLSDNLGIPSVDNSEPLTMNELPDDEYRHMVQTLKSKKNSSIMYYI